MSSSSSSSDEDSSCSSVAFSEIDDEEPDVDAGAHEEDSGDPKHPFRLGKEHRWSLPYGKYRLVWTGYLLYCTCPAWKYQRRPNAEKCCKHMIERFPNYQGVKLNEKQVRVKPPPFFLVETFDTNEPMPALERGEFWWSEKYDGVRLYWNGEHFVLRSGLTARVPKELERQMPADVHLDLEMWCGPQGFQDVQGVLDLGSRHPLWQKPQGVRLMVIDSPSWPELNFEERYCKLLKLHKAMGGSAGAPFEVIRQHSFKGTIQELEKKLATITKAGGEGIVLRKRAAMYRAGRGGKLALKLKMAKTLQVALVRRGDKKHTWVARTLNAAQREFNLALSLHDETEHRKQLKPGARVEILHSGFTLDGVPKHARFEGMAQ